MVQIEWPVGSGCWDEYEIGAPHPSGEGVVCFPVEVKPATPPEPPTAEDLKPALIECLNEPTEEFKAAMLSFLTTCVTVKVPLGKPDIGEGIQGDDIDGDGDIGIVDGTFELVTP